MPNSINRKLRSGLELLGLLGLAIVVAFFAQKWNSQPSEERAHASVEIPKSEGPALGEVKKLNPEKAYGGYTLYTQVGNAKIDLINLKGKSVHSWEIDADRARLLPSGNILVVHGSKWGLRREPWKSLRSTVREYGWSGEVVWEYTADDVIHHEAQRLENGTTIFLVRNILPPGFSHQILDNLRKGAELKTDKILEVYPEGKIAWKWEAQEHLDLNECGRGGCNHYVGSASSGKKLRDWTHLNTVSVIPENKWFDQGDTRFRPGNIITLPRNWWQILLIDRDSKEVVWDYGGDYKGGLSGGHEAHMIPKGVPGAGNILVFDNGSKTHKGESFVLEIDPTTKKVVWVYDAGKELHSKARGSAARLPNGNTLISEDLKGRLLEVTPDKEIVWEFVGEQQSNRAQRYAYDYSPKFKNLPR